MKIAILGYGEQGRAAYEYWGKDPANQLVIRDQNEELAAPAGAMTMLGPQYLDNLDQYDLLIRSPALHPRDIVAANSPDILSKVTTVTSEFMSVCPSRNIIGITGTKGKGTTSTLVTRMLEAAGKTVHLGGNIGIPPLDMLANRIQPDDWVVLELANFQLIDLKQSPHIAVCLMVVPEHLNWHADIQEYIESKQQLFASQTTDDIAIYYAANQNSVTVASAGQATKIPFYQAPGAYVDNGSIVMNGHAICKTDEIKLLGKHNWQNICAAVTAVWQVTQDVQALHDAILAFEGLPHRLEFVRTINDISYYNDSFAATPEAALAALEAIPGKKVAIIGGFDRQLPLEDFAKTISNSTADICKLLLIGQAKDRIGAALQAVGYTNFVVSPANTMADVIMAAQAEAEAGSGDVILLSPGFPSFDMFKNFEDRGEQFKAAVNTL
jgi:UDP-N-acetylmuramoylalanine--D-glutamate ligase